MAIPDASLGIDVDFDGDVFRSAIRFAMEMGAPPDEGRQAVFVFKSAGRSYWKDGVELVTPPRTDQDGKPLDPTIEVRELPGRREKVDCAVEIKRADAEELPVGNFRPTKAEVTLLDEEYARVQGCRELIYNADRYLYGYEPEALGMFDVGTHTIVFYAIDES